MVRSPFAWIPMWKSYAWDSSTASMISSGVMVRMPWSSVPSYGVLMYIVRPEAEPSAPYLTAPIRSHSLPKPRWIPAVLRAAYRSEAAEAK